MNSLLREQAIQLRLKEGLSYGEIRDRLGVPKSTLSYWLRELPLSEERILQLKRDGWRKSEAAREKFRITMRQKRELANQEVYDRHFRYFKMLSGDAFFVAGLILYLAEGAKRDYSRIGFANTDPKVIQFFIDWLGEFLKVPSEKIKIGLHLYENMDIEKEKEFWKDKTGLDYVNFYKPSIRKLQKSSFSYKDSYRHGTCCVYVLGVEKKREIMMAIQAFLDTYQEKRAISSFG